MTISASDLIDGLGWVAIQDRPDAATLTKGGGDLSLGPRFGISLGRAGPYFFGMSEVFGPACYLAKSQWLCSVD